jgi:hypothetical protein
MGSLLMVSMMKQAGEEINEVDTVFLYGKDSMEAAGQIRRGYKGICSDGKTLG